MKMQHWAIVTLTIVGLAYAYHMFASHGTFKQGLAGLGINR